MASKCGTATKRLVILAAMAGAWAACTSLEAPGPAGDGSGIDPMPGPNDPIVCMNPSADGKFSLGCKAVAVLVDGHTDSVVDTGQIVGVALTGAKPGASVTVPFTLRNLANPATMAVLRVRSFAISDKTGTFACVGADGGACRLGDLTIVPPDAAESGHRVHQAAFGIRYKPAPGAPSETQVRLEMHGDPQSTSLEFTVRAILGTGHLIATPAQLDFGPVKAGDHPVLPVTVANVGDAPVQVLALEVAGTGPFAAVSGTQTIPAGKKQDLVKPWLLAPGESVGMTVRFDPTQGQPATGTLNVHSDAKSGLLQVPLLGNTKVPCALLTPAKLSFGGEVVGTPVPRVLDLKNCGSVPLEVSKLALAAGSHANFTLDKVPFVGAGVLPIGGMAKIGVTYTPDHVNKPDPATGKLLLDTATIEVVSNAGKTVAQLDGHGLDYACPTAVIDIKEGEEVIPQTTLHLSGLKSTGKGAAPVAAYKWSVKQPFGSVQVFKLNATSPTVTFKPDVAGEYVFSLEVFDAQGVKSCKPATASVLVVPEGCLHIELLWSTPADPDPTDTGPAAGADLDLHFASPLAQAPDIDCDSNPDPWFSNPYDTFWFNPNPNWGSFDPAVDDDPSLDLDDTDGAGPENLNFGCEAEPGQYPLGVHYWNDHGFGVSFATIRIYVGTVLAVTIIDVKLKPLDMWYVGKVNLPNGVTTAGAPQPLTSCKQSGDACLYKKAPTSSKAGKMWQPTGTHCITPCYESPSMGGTSPGTCTPLGP